MKRASGVMQTGGARDQPRNRYLSKCEMGSGCISSLGRSLRMTLQMSVCSCMQVPRYPQTFMNVIMSAASSQVMTMQETSHSKPSHSRSLAYNWCRLIKFCRMMRISVPNRGSKDSGTSLPESSAYSSVRAAHASIHLRQLTTLYLMPVPRGKLLYWEGTFPCLGKEYAKSQSSERKPVTGKEHPWMLD